MPYNLKKFRILVVIIISIFIVFCSGIFIRNHPVENFVYFRSFFHVNTNKIRHIYTIKPHLSNAKQLKRSINANLNHLNYPFYFFCCTFYPKFVANFTTRGFTIELTRCKGIYDFRLTILLIVNYPLLIVNFSEHSFKKSCPRSSEIFISKARSMLGFFSIL